MEKLTPVEVTLNLGEALFIPIAWWYTVEVLNVSISITFTDFIVPNYFPAELPRG